MGVGVGVGVHVGVLYVGRMQRCIGHIPRNGLTSKTYFFNS